MKNAAGIFTPIVINYILKNYIIIILVHQMTFKVCLNIKYHTVNFGSLPPPPSSTESTGTEFSFHENLVGVKRPLSKIFKIRNNYF